MRTEHGHEHPHPNHYGACLRGTRGAILVAIFLLATQGPSLAQIPKGDFTIVLETVATGLTAPVELTHAGDGSGRLFIVDQVGLIHIVSGGVLLPTPFLDLTAVVAPLNVFFDERGLLGLAFHPQYAANGRFFVRYSTWRHSARNWKPRA